MDPVHEEYRRNVLASYVQQAVGFLHAFVVPMIAVRIWGRDVYGLWLLTTSYLAHLTLGATLGMDNAAFVLIGRRRSRRERTLVHRRVTTVLSGIAIVLAGTWLASQWAAPGWYRLLGRIPPELDGTARRLVDTTVLFFVLGMPLAGSPGTLSGTGKQHWRTWIETGITLASMASMVTCAVLGLGLQAFVLSFFAAQTIAAVARTLLAARTLRESPPVVAGDPNSGWADILRCGTASLGGSLAGMGIQLVETVALGRFFLLDAVATYVLSSKIANLAFAFCMSLNLALAAPIARVIREGRDATRLLAGFERRSMAVGTVVATGLVLFADPFVRLWVGEETRPGQDLVFLLALYGLLYLRTNLLVVTANAGGKVTALAATTWGELATKAALILLLVHPFGLLAIPLAGIAASALLPNLVLPFVIRGHVLPAAQRGAALFVPAFGALLAAQALATCGIDMLRWGVGSALLACTGAVAFRAWKKEISW